MPRYNDPRKKAFERLVIAAECNRTPDHARVKMVREFIGDTVDDLIRELRALGLLADNCDRVFELEADIYAYVKASNPADPAFRDAEAFAELLEDDEDATPAPAPAVAPQVAAPAPAGPTPEQLDAEVETFLEEDFHTRRAIAQAEGE